MYPIYYVVKFSRHFFIQSKSFHTLVLILSQLFSFFSLFTTTTRRMAYFQLYWRLVWRWLGLLWVLRYLRCLGRLGWQCLTWWVLRSVLWGSHVLNTSEIWNFYLVRKKSKHKRLLRTWWHPWKLHIRVLELFNFFIFLIHHFKEVFISHIESFAFI